MKTSHCVIFGILSAFCGSTALAETATVNRVQGDDGRDKYLLGFAPSATVKDAPDNAHSAAADLFSILQDANASIPWPGSRIALYISASQTTASKILDGSANELHSTAGIVFSDPGELRVVAGTEGIDVAFTGGPANELQALMLAAGRESKCEVGNPFPSKGHVDGWICCPGETPEGPYTRCSFSSIGQ